MNHSDWESQRERLSAYLDGELSPAERAALDPHLRDCEQCQRELAALRQTRALLRALPTPALPRDFSLPAQPVVVERKRAAPAWARPAQAIGTIAAMIGLAFLFATALPNLPRPMAGGAATSESNHTVSGPAAPSAQQGSADAAMTPSPNSASPSGVQSTHSVTPTVSPTSSTFSSEKTPTQAPAGATTGTSTGGGYGPIQSGSSGSGAATAQPFPVAPVAGVTLLLGGVAMVAVGSLARRRSRGDEPDEPDDAQDSW